MWKSLSAGTLWGLADVAGELMSGRWPACAVADQHFVPPGASILTVGSPATCSGTAFANAANAAFNTTLSPAFDP
jgi:hypothetical protein